MKMMAVAVLVMLMAPACLSDTTTNKPLSAMERKLDAIILPVVEWNQANLNDVCPLLSSQTGVSIILGDRQNEAEISMAEKNISLLQVLRRLSQVSGLVLDLDGKDVVLRRPRDKR